MNSTELRQNSIQRTVSRAKRLHKKIMSYNVRNLLKEGKKGDILDALFDEYPNAFKINNNMANQWSKESSDNPAQSATDFGGKLIKSDFESDNGFTYQVDDSDSDLSDNSESYSGTWRTISYDTFYNDVVNYNSSDDVPEEHVPYFGGMTVSNQAKCQEVDSCLDEFHYLVHKLLAHTNGQLIAPYRYRHQYQMTKKLLAEKKTVFKHKSVPSIIKNYLWYHPSASPKTVAKRTFLTSHWTDKYLKLVKKQNKKGTSLNNVFKDYQKKTNHMSYNRWKSHVLKRLYKAHAKYAKVHKAIKKDLNRAKFHSSHNNKQLEHNYKCYANNHQKRFNQYVTNFHRFSKSFGLGSLNPNSLLSRKIVYNHSPFLTTPKYNSKLHKYYQRYVKKCVTSRAKRTYSKKFHQYIRSLFANA